MSTEASIQKAKDYSYWHHVLVVCRVIALSILWFLTGLFTTYRIGAQNLANTQAEMTRQAIHIEHLDGLANTQDERMRELGRRMRNVDVAQVKMFDQLALISAEQSKIEGVGLGLGLIFAVVEGIKAIAARGMRKSQP